LTLLFTGSVAELTAVTPGPALALCQLFVTRLAFAALLFADDRGRGRFGFPALSLRAILALPASSARAGFRGSAVTLLTVWPLGSFRAITIGTIVATTVLLFCVRGLLAV
tara:strand:+ start:611 stop:940 length:330 start_codon:yes stop_codon:yes gene_type:complete